MPKYKNNTSSAITPIHGPTVAAGAVTTHKDYFKNPKGLTLQTHMQNGINGVLLHAGSPGSAGDLSVAEYDYVEVVNETDDVVQIYYNADDTNYLPVPAGRDRIVENKNLRTWHTMTLAGSGSGSVYVIGYR